MLTHSNPFSTEIYVAFSNFLSNNRDSFKKKIV